MLPGDTATEENPDSCKEPRQVKKWGKGQGDSKGRGGGRPLSYPVEVNITRICKIIPCLLKQEKE